MLEWVMIGCTVYVPYRIAESDERPPALWMAVAFGVCLAFVALVPWPLLRIALAFGAVLALMLATRAIRELT